MERIIETLIGEVNGKGFPKIAALWQSILEDGCTLYLRSEEGYQPLDGYALHCVSRYLPATATNIEIVPVYDHFQTVSYKNLIILGRIRAFGPGSEKLISETAGKVIQDYGHFRFMDSERLLQVDSGEMWMRVEMQKWIRDFGVIRLWRQPDTGRIIMNLCGLGPIGTLGATMAITDFSKSAVAEVELLLPPPKELREGLVEILVKAERQPKGDSIIISPAEVTINVEKHFHSFAEPNWPLMVFHRTTDDDGDQYEVRVFDTRSDTKKLLTRAPVEFAVLAAIAKHTEEEPSMYAPMGGYIAYQQIAKSVIVKEILRDSQGLDISVVRATVARLNRKLRIPEWDRVFPNLLLQCKVPLEGSKTKKAVLRLRAKIHFEI